MASRPREVVSSPSPYRGPSPRPQPASIPPGQRRLDTALFILALLVLILLGLATLLWRDLTSPTPQPIPLSQEDMDSAWQWVFQSVIPHAKVEAVQMVDPIRGPLLAVVSSPEGHRWAYEVVIVRQDSEWKITGRRLGSPALEQSDN